jgi:hypothetical protein
MREYDVKFTDGMMGKYAVNVIADNMYAQVDNKGNMFHFLLFLFLEEYLDDTTFILQGENGVMMVRCFLACICKVVHRL